MATLEQIEQALRAADAAGNADDARALAQAYAEMRRQQLGSSAGPAGATAPPAAAPPALRHPDGRLTEAGWEAERKALEASRQAEIDGGSFLGNLVAGYGRAMPSLLQGGKQFLTEAIADRTDSVGAALAGIGIPGAERAREDAAAYFGGLIDKQQAATAQERQESADLRGTGGGVLGNIAGDIVATAPLAGAGVAARGAGAVRSIGQAALGGGAAGGIQPVAADDERLSNALLGAGAGGALAGAGRGVMRVAEELVPANQTSRVINWFNSRANQEPFAQEGEALAQRTGIDLTPGMVSGSRAQTGAENMARQSLFSADTVFKADEKVANQAIQYVERVMQRISDDSLSPQGIGTGIQRTVRDAVEKIADSREKMAAQQFGAIRKMVGDRPIVDYTNTRNALQGILDEFGDVIGGDAAKIRGQAQRLLDEIVAKPDGVSLDAARRARGFYGAAARGKSNLFDDVSPDLNRRLAARMYGAMSDDLDAAGAKLDEAAGFGRNMPVPEGVQAMRPSEMLRQANDDYRRHSQMLEAVKNSPLQRLIGDEFSVDDFMTVNTLPPETVIQRIGAMKPSELNMVRDFMEKNAPDTWQSYKRMLVEDALAQAQSAPASAGAKTLPFNASGFVRALGGDKPDKVERLRSLFNPGEMAEVMDAMQAARRMGDKFGANFSGTGPYQEVAQALRNFSVRGLSTTATTALGFNRVARMMVNSDGRRAILELAKVPPGTKRANDLAAYLASISALSVNVPENEPLEIDIVGGRRESEVR